MTKSTFIEYLETTITLFMAGRQQHTYGKLVGISEDYIVLETRGIKQVYFAMKYIESFWSDKDK